MLASCYRVVRIIKQEEKEWAASRRGQTMDWMGVETERGGDGSAGDRDGRTRRRKGDLLMCKEGNWE